jgi:hypothetical protein
MRRSAGAPAGPGQLIQGGQRMNADKPGLKDRDMGSQKSKDSSEILWFLF